MDADAKAFLKKAADKFYLSGRAIHKIIKVARTVADLEGESDIKLPQMAEGLQYRAG